MLRQIGTALLLAHVLAQRSRIDLLEIDHDEAVEHIGEVLVHVEAQDRGVELQVMLQQHGDTFAIRL
ncbi:MAG: hypothetical protein ACK55Z_34810, partial [bacterium]